MQEQALVVERRIGVEMSEAAAFQGAGAAHHAVDFVAFGEEQLGQVGAVLASDAGDECALHEDYRRDR